MNTCAKVYIALGHQARVGKDTFANYVEKWCHDRNINCQILTIAAKLYTITYSIQETLGQVKTKDRGLLQLVGMNLRAHYGDDIWINSTMQSLDKEATVVIVTDMRFKNEMKILQDHGFITVKIMRECMERAAYADHISEIDLEDATFDHTVINDGTLEDYFKRIRSFLEKIIV